MTPTHPTEECYFQLLLVASVLRMSQAHRCVFIVNKITGDSQEDGNFTLIPTDGNLTTATADNCY